MAVASPFGHTFRAVGLSSTHLLSINFIFIQGESSGTCTLFLARDQIGQKTTWIRVPSIIGSFIHSSRLVFLSPVAELGVQPSLHLFPVMCIRSVEKCHRIKMAAVLGIAGIRYDTVTGAPSATGSSCGVQNKARQRWLTDLHRMSSAYDHTIRLRDRKLWFLIVTNRKLIHTVEPERRFQQAYVMYEVVLNLNSNVVTQQHSLKHDKSLNACC